MKLAIFALVCFISALVSAEVEQEFELDWHHIKPIDIKVEPIGPANINSPGLRVIGGSVAPRNGFPYQAALIINNSGFCGGSIISNQYILTAAHCIDTATNVQVIVGAHNPRTSEFTQVRLNAAGRIIHNSWNPSTLRNDIALLRVASIPLNQHGISAVSLAPANAGTFAGSIATLSGWGRTSDSSNGIATQLKHVQLPVITNAVCRNSFGSTINDQHICTSGQGGRGSCNGDSGGPLVVNGVEVGVVSFGSSRCQSGHPSVFARVSYFRQWIRNNSGV